MTTERRSTGSQRATTPVVEDHWGSGPSVGGPTLQERLDAREAIRRCAPLAVNLVKERLYGGVPEADEIDMDALAVLIRQRFDGFVDPWDRRE